MRTLRTLLATALLTVALAGHAQQPPRGVHPGGGMGHGFYGAPAYARGPQGYGGQRYAAPRFAPQTYAPQRFAPPPGYAPYGRPPYGQAAPAANGWRQQEEFVRQGVRRGQLAPLGRVIGNIRQITPGRQLDAGLEYMGPRLVYRVRWMTARGRRVDYLVDAATGAILSGR